MNWKQLTAACLLALGLGAAAEERFERLTLYPIKQNNPSLRRTAAEILTVAGDGRTLVYADSLGRGVGFVNLTDPRHPKPLGWVKLPGEPTSVAAKGRWALVVTDKESALLVYDVKTQKLVARHSIPGQPDAIDISPDGRFAAICIENESRQFPQPPPGSLVVVTLDGEPSKWKLENVNLQGLAKVESQDPEPEYVDINEQNLAVVTLQENNHLVLVDLERKKVVDHFFAGSAVLQKVDLQKDKRLQFSGSVGPLRREPDSVQWCSAGILTADEGDYVGGTRSFSLFNNSGGLLYWSGNLTDRLAASLGQYPDHRSERRGTEPESLTVATFGGREFVFVGCERANLVFVFEINNGVLRYFQSLYTGPGPESITAVPSRNLLILGSEVSEPKNGLHSYLSVFRFGETPPAPHITGDIPWQSLSGLTFSDGVLYSVMDNAIRPPTIVTIEPATRRLKKALTLKGKYDLEGIAKSSSGGFWAVSEGSKKKPNLLLRISDTGEVKEVELPDFVRAKATKRGLEGVAVTGGHVYVGFQSRWKGDPVDTTKIGRYNPASGEWAFATYQLADGHYLTGLCAGPSGTLAVLERDKEAREYARHKAIFTVNPSDFGKGRLRKIKVVDLIAEFKRQNLPVVSKLEGVAYDGRSFWVVNDNDGVKDSYGETLLLKVDHKDTAK